MRRSGWALLVLLACARPAAAAECYQVTPAAGSVSFELKQAGAPFRGTFHRFGGELCLAEREVSRISVWLDPGSVDTGLPEIDAALREETFFDLARHPRIAFVSRSVERAGAARRARGTLEINGRRRDVAVEFRLHAGGGAPAVSGSFELNRLDYAVGTGEWSNTDWLGAQVRVGFRATLERRND